MPRNAPQHEQAFEQAIEDLEKGVFDTIAAAARAYNLDRTTLSRRIKGTTKRSAAHSEQQALSPEQEKLLAQWILQLEDTGHAVGHAQVKEMAVQILRFSGKSHAIGKNWVTRFLQRHPEIHTKIGKKIDALRLNGTTPEILCAWFSLFEGVLTQFKIKPEHIWNMDETGIALGICQNQTVIGSSNSRYTYQKAPENREWVSILECISATGARTRCLVIFKGQSIQTS
jgi:hypothetical protein